MGKYEYTNNQQWWTGNSFMMWITGTWSWVQPLADTIDPPRDTRKVVSYDPNKKFSLPGNLNYGEYTYNGFVSAPGIPAQAVPDNAPLREWAFGTSQYGVERRNLPTPAETWVEGMPRTQTFPWTDAPGAYDRHVIFVYSDRIVEMIGVNSRLNTAEAAVCFSKTGEWLWGAPLNWKSVCAAGFQMTKYMLTRKSLEQPHTLGLALGNYGGADGDLKNPDGTPVEFPRCGQRVVLPVIPPGLTGDTLKVAQMLNTYGAVIYDRNNNMKDGWLLTQSGAQWLGSDLNKKGTIPLSELRLVTEVA